MNSNPSFVQRHAQAVFWAIAWATSFFGYYMSTVYPSDVWLVFVFGPFVGGALVTALADGRAGLKTFFSRIVRWRVGVRWYAVGLLLPLGLRLAAFAASLASGATPAPELPMPLLMNLLFESFVFSLIIALGEEPGFRGFALPRLLVGRSALAASLILGFFHTIWHAPLLVTGAEPLIIVPIIFSGAILNTWLFNHTNGSVFLAILLHASVDLWAGFFNPLLAPADAAVQTVWLAVFYAIVAVALPILTGKELGRQPEAAAAQVEGARQPVLVK